MIKIDWTAGVVRTRKELDVRTTYLFRQNAESLGVTGEWDTDISGQFETLIRQVSARYDSPVVILVDEYDKPLRDNIDDPHRASEMREGLKNVYSCLKKVDHLLQFVFLTGVSKFSKVNIFSGVNNLQDITLDKRYAHDVRLHGK